MICKNCNGTIEENAEFCSKCGSRVKEDDQQTSGSSMNASAVKKILTDTQDDTSSFDEKDINDNKVMAGLSYFIFFLPLLASPNSKFARFHANQSLILLITYILGGIVNAILSGIIIAISWRLWFLTSLINLIIWLPLGVLGIMGLINGFTGKAKQLPFIGKFKIIK